jgi:hypothetical protein
MSHINDPFARLESGKVRYRIVLDGKPKLRLEKTCKMPSRASRGGQRREM